MIQLIENCDLRKYVVVIPSVCVGNVGQLAADLLIFNLDLKRLGYLWHSQILTFCGADPYGNSDCFSTAKNSRCILEEIVLWLKQHQVSQIIILSGISAHRRADRQLFGKPLRYVFCSKTETKELENAKTRDWQELENIGSVEDSSSSIPSSLPGAGSAVKYFHKCVDNNIPCAILFEFCSDGNNSPDALRLVEYLDEWQHFKERQRIDSWIIPKSWSFLFGLPPPSEIFN